MGHELSLKYIGHAHTPLITKAVRQKHDGRIEFSLVRVLTLVNSTVSYFAACSPYTPYLTSDSITPRVSVLSALATRARTQISINYHPVRARARTR